MSCIQYNLGAHSRTRTSTPFRARDFKSLVSTYFTIRAIWCPLTESNRAPTDYESAALTMHELRGHVKLCVYFTYCI